MQELQKKMFHLIYDEGDDSLPARIFDFAVIALIVLNIVFLVLDTFTMPLWYERVSQRVENISVVVFSLEYLLRVWVAPSLYPKMHPHVARLRYIFSFMAIVDLLAVLPFYVRFLPGELRILRALRIVRLLRVFKINRYTDAINTIGDVFRKRANQLFSSLFVVGLLLVVASVLMWNVEHKAQPEVFANALDALWWAMGTVTTAGYGDIYPITILGKILGAVISLLGIGIVAVPTGIISAGFIEAIDSTQNMENQIAEDIQRYKELLDNGAITQQEYDAKKTQLLNKKEE